MRVEDKELLSLGHASMAHSGADDQWIARYPDRALGFPGS